MKKWLVLGVFVLMGSVLFAQGNGQDVVYLRKGSVIRGNIVEQIPNQSVKIEAADGNIWVYRMDEIEKMIVATSLNNYQDVVYLKNGSVIRGAIIEQLTEMSPVKIETADGSVWIYQMDEILKITKEQRVGRRVVYSVKDRLVGTIDASSSSNGGTGLRRGSKLIFESGYLGESGSYGLDRAKLNFIAGYQANPYFSFGFGTGVRYYTDNDAAVVPLFLDFRVNFMNRKVSPYFAFDMGYSYDTDAEDWAGAMTSGTLGASIRLAKKLALNIGLEYEAQGVEFYDRHYGHRRSEVSGALGVSVGISF